MNDVDVEVGMKKPGKKKSFERKKSSFVTFRMDDDNLRLLEKIAASQMRSRSAQCFYVISEYIKNHCNVENKL